MTGGGNGEPTTALDVTVQRQILDLLRRVQRDHGMSMMLISHDLAVVAGRTDRVAVMYAGRLAEVGSTREVFDAPRHRYTHALLDSVPLTDPEHPFTGPALEGDLPSPWHPAPDAASAPAAPEPDNAAQPKNQKSARSDPASTPPATSPSTSLSTSLSTSPSTSLSPPHTVHDPAECALDCGSLGVSRHVVHARRDQGAAGPRAGVVGALRLLGVHGRHGYTPPG